MLENRLFFAVASRSGFGAAISDPVARSSIVFLNSVFADRIVVAASSLLGAAAECVTRDLFLKYVVWIKTICCCIADACACRTLTAMARVPVRAARSRHDCCQGFRVRWKRTMICWVLSSAYF